MVWTMNCQCFSQPIFTITLICDHRHLQVYYSVICKCEWTFYRISNSFLLNDRLLVDAISESSPRVVDDNRARKLSNELRRCSYYETCATYGLNVERVFQDGKSFFFFFVFFLHMISEFKRYYSIRNYSINNFVFIFFLLKNNHTNWQTNLCSSW